MNYYVAGVDRDTRQQTLFEEFKNKKKAVDCLVKNMPNYDDDDIIMTSANSKEEFAENYPGYMGIRFFQQLMYKKYGNPVSMLPEKQEPENE